MHDVKSVVGSGFSQRGHYEQSPNADLYYPLPYSHVLAVHIE